MTLLLLEIAILVNIVIALLLYREWRELRRTYVLLAGIVKSIGKIKADMQASTSKAEPTK